MVQTIPFVNTPNKANQSFSLSLLRDQYAEITVEDDGNTYGFFLSSTADGDAQIALYPRNSTVRIFPSIVSGIPEGSTFWSVNVWDITDAEKPQQVATGKVTMTASIAPIFAGHSTQYLSEKRTIVSLTQSEYNALASAGSLDADTYYDTY